MIYTLDGKPMENSRQFAVNLYRKPIGQVATLEVRRGPQRQILRVPVVERPDDGARLSALVTPEENLVPRLGVLGLALTAELAQMIPGVRAPQGVVVASVASDAVARLEPGDVIHALNGAAVANLAQLRAGLDPLPAGQVVQRVAAGGSWSRSRMTVAWSAAPSRALGGFSLFSEVRPGRGRPRRSSPPRLLLPRRTIISRS
jgi:S1-C subfamily serine protease